MNATGKECDAPMASAGQSLDLTVVIPHFNHGHLITRAVDSVLAQTTPPARILVIDDASTDSSLEVLKALEARHPCLDLVRNEVNLGVNGNANKGLALCTTEYVTFMGADDTMNPHLYETAVTCLNAHPQANACCTDAEWMDEAGNTLPQPASVNVLDEPGYVSAKRAFELMENYGSFLVGGGCVFRTRPFQGEGGLSADIGPYADSYVLQRMAAKSGICYIPQRLYTWQRSIGGYAISTAANAQALFDLYDKVTQRMQVEDAGLFPQSYLKRHDARWRFDVARTAILGQPRANEVIKAIAPSGVAGILLRLAASYLPKRFAVLAAFMLLRPADALFAVRRRIGT